MDDNCVFNIFFSKSSGTAVTFRGRLQTQNNVIVTLVGTTPPPERHTSDIKQNYCPSEITVAPATTLVSAVIPLNELLILSCWMVVNCTYLLLKHGAKQYFVGRQNVTRLTPPSP